MDNIEMSAIAECKRGNTEAFGPLYEAYVDRIFRFLLTRTRQKEVAEDLTSQTFIKALKSIRSFNEKRGNFSSWLYRIAQNNLIDHLRGNKQIQNLDNIFSLHDNSSLLEDLENKVEIEKVIKYLESLPQEQKNIITMRVWDDMSYADISALLGKSEASCKMMFSRAIAKIRKEMPIALVLFFFMSLTTTL